MEVFLMKYLWNYIREKEWSDQTKYMVTVLIYSLISALLGFVVWLVLRNWVLNSWEWMFCFMGYPAVAAWIGVFLAS